MKPGRCSGEHPAGRTCGDHRRERVAVRGIGASRGRQSGPVTSTAAVQKFASRCSAGLRSPEMAQSKSTWRAEEAIVGMPLSIRHSSAAKRFSAFVLKCTQRPFWRCIATKPREMCRCQNAPSRDALAGLAAVQRIAGDLGDAATIMSSNMPIM
jgi:hypothetical protein